MPTLKPIVLELPSDVTVTYNPIILDGARTSFVEDANKPIGLLSKINVRTRAASINNAGHVVETTLISPIEVEVPAGCCPTSGTPPVSSFNLRFTRGTFETPDGAEKLYNELVSYVQTEDFKALVMGSSYY